MRMKNENANENEKFVIYYLLFTIYYLLFTIYYLLFIISQFLIPNY